MWLATKRLRHEPNTSSHPARRRSASLSPSRVLDKDGAYFSSLFGEGSGTCKDLRRALKSDVDAIKSAQKKADDDFVAEQSAPPQEGAARAPQRKGSETAALREIAKKTKQAEQTKECSSSGVAGP